MQEELGAACVLDVGNEGAWMGLQVSRADEHMDALMGALFLWAYLRHKVR